MLARPHLLHACATGKWTIEPVWTTKDVSLYLSNPVVVGDALFGFSRRASGQFFALDAKSGKVLWLGPPRQATNSAVSKAGDLLFLLNDDAALIIAKSSRTGFEPLKSAHRCRERHLGPACHFRESDLHQGRLVPDAMDH